MASWDQPVRDMTNSRPLFLTIYATVLIGLLVSSFYVLSAIYGGKSPVYGSFSSPPALSRGSSAHMDQAPNSSNSNAEGGVPTPSSLLSTVSVRPIWEVPPTGSKMPPLKDFQFTKALVKQRAKDNIIIVTFGNYAFLDFILNWVKHLTDLSLSNILVGAMDTKILEALYWKGVPVFDMGSHMTTADAGWGSATFHRMGREKVILIDAILPFDYELLMCDTDMVWLKNPLPYIARFPEADVLTSTDQLIPTVVDDNLDIWQQVTGAYNIGIFHWRPTDPAKKLAKEWKEMLLADEKLWDQQGFNDILHKQLGPSVDEENGLVYAFDGTVKLGLLPASIFCSGHTYFVQAMYQQLRLEPYAVHTTFQYAGTEGKRHRLREGLFFFDEPEYYDSPGGFLSFKPSIPKSLLLDGEHNIESHFALINYQIKQIRTALAIASLLNRTLVMPPLWCRLDRLWFPHSGFLTGTMTRQPFLCPLDHVFEGANKMWYLDSGCSRHMTGDRAQFVNLTSHNGGDVTFGDNNKGKVVGIGNVNVMLREHPEEEFGPGIDFREYSFLDNPLLPNQVKESWLDVQLCQEESQDCHLSNETAQPGILRFPKHCSEEKFRTVFSSFRNVKVIQFSTMQDAFQGFTDQERVKKFRNRVKRYVGLWCCVQGHDPGHIYYDMYWDEKPGWKPVPPQTPEDDHPY